MAWHNLVSGTCVELCFFLWPDINQSFNTVMYILKNNNLILWMVWCSPPAHLKILPQISQVSFPVDSRRNFYLLRHYSVSDGIVVAFIDISQEKFLQPEYFQICGTKLLPSVSWPFPTSHSFPGNTNLVRIFCRRQGVQRRKRGINTAFKDFSDLQSTDLISSISSFLNNTSWCRVFLP